MSRSSLARSASAPRGQKLTEPREPGSNYRGTRRWWVKGIWVSDEEVGHSLQYTSPNQHNQIACNKRKKKATTGRRRICLFCSPEALTLAAQRVVTVAAAHEWCVVLAIPVRGIWHPRRLASRRAGACSHGCRMACRELDWCARGSRVWIGLFHPRLFDGACGEERKSKSSTASRCTCAAQNRAHICCHDNLRAIWFQEALKGAVKRGKRKLCKRRTNTGRNRKMCGTQCYERLERQERCMVHTVRGEFTSMSRREAWRGWTMRAGMVAGVGGVSE